MIIIANSRQTEQIAELLKTNTTYIQIAEQFGISKQRVGQIAKRYNLTRNKSRKS